MASKFFASTAARRALAGGVAVGASGLGYQQYTKRDLGEVRETEAEIQFRKSYGWVQNKKQMIKPPDGWIGPLFEIRNDYPSLKKQQELASKTANLPPLPGPDLPLPGTDPLRDAPWLQVCFRKEPERYCQIIKEYCWEGNINNDFVVQRNTIRRWYHAPWMHWNKNGREPLHGLTFERVTPAKELARTQNRQLQTWAIGFYNWMGATVFGDIWENPNTPKWEKGTLFPLGTCVFKILMTDAKNSEVPSMIDAPEMQAVITAQDAENATFRNDKPSTVRLLQVDFAVRDDRADVGWVFGTFMYNGYLKDKIKEPWDRIIPVGITWGNDPDLTPAKVAQGDKPTQCWINPAADALRHSLGGQRPSWGWNGRMNGPADNFISACASCHSTSQKIHPVNMTWAPTGKPPPPPPPDDVKMLWFRNLKPGEPFCKDDVSGDYSLQLMFGWANYQSWRNSTKGLFYKTKVAIPWSATRKEADAIEAKRELSRGGPDISYDTPDGSPRIG